MRVPPLLASLLVLLGASSARSQTVIVPETPYGGPVSLTAQATAMLDHDSVLMTSTAWGGAVLGTAEFLVVNIDTGAIELQPVLLPAGYQVSSVAALSPTAGLIAVRDDNNFQSRGKYFVVNTLTGAIVRGPVTFTTAGTSWEYRIAVIDPSTVLIVHRSDIGSAGVLVVDPQTGTVKVAEKPFAPGPTNTMEVALLDPHRVAIAYGTPGPDLRMSFTVVDPQDGAVARRCSAVERARVPRLDRHHRFASARAPTTRCRRASTAAHSCCS